MELFEEKNGGSVKGNTAPAAIYAARLAFAAARAFRFCSLNVPFSTSLTSHQHNTINPALIGGVFYCDTGAHDPRTDCATG